MHEQILIAPNGAELLRMLARNGFQTLGLRIMQPIELARFALMRSGFARADKLLRTVEEAALCYRFIQEIPYFQNASFHDAQNLADTLRELRLQIIDDERTTIETKLQNSVFKEKNAALLSAYDNYQALLKSNHCTDTVGLIRLAIEHSRPLSLDCMVLDAFPLRPLERELLSRVSSGSYTVVSISSLLGKESPSALPVPHITEAYGAANEAEAVIGAMLSGKLAPDQCTIAVTDTASYIPLLYELTSRHKIPITFGCGLPVTLSTGARVLSDYQHWQTDGHFGIDALRSLIFGGAFDTEAFCKEFGFADRKQLHRFVEAAGSLRLGTDTAQNQTVLEHFRNTAHPEETLVTQLQTVFVQFGMPCTELIQRYVRIRKDICGRMDKAAIHKICDTMEQFAAATETSADMLIPDLLKSHICAENSHSGALHITTISGALTSLRRNLFIMGLSAEKFSGKPEENYLLLDHESSAFGADAPTSLRRIQQAKQELYTLLQTAAALDVTAQLSYSGYDTAELKLVNASSVLFELYQEASYGVQKVGYFEQNLSGAAEIGRAYLNGEKVAEAPAQPEPSQVCADSKPKLSPSAVETYVTCPKKFCCEHILHIREPETDDPLEIISPKQFGNLIHEVMEQRCRMPQQTKEEFFADAMSVFETFLAERPPMHEADADTAREKFRKAVERGYDLAYGRRLTAPEQKICVEYDGFTLNGRLDALEELPDGTCRVIDYKTGKKVKHEKSDPSSCIQVMLYADMLTAQGKTVKGGEYWYLLGNEVIPCDYTQDTAGTLKTILGNLANSIQEHQYPANPSDDNCRYCFYRSICEEGRHVK